MQITIPATKAKNNFGELIRRVYTTGEHVIVEKDGIPVVVIGPIRNLDLRKNDRKRAIPAARYDAETKQAGPSRATND